MQSRRASYALRSRQTHPKLRTKIRPWLKKKHSIEFRWQGPKVFESSILKAPWAGVDRSTVSSQNWSGSNGAAAKLGWWRQREARFFGVLKKLACASSRSP